MRATQCAALIKDKRSARRYRVIVDQSTREEEGRGMYFYLPNESKRISTDNYPSRRNEGKYFDNVPIYRK